MKVPDIPRSWLVTAAFILLAAGLAFVVLYTSYKDRKDAAKPAAKSDVKKASPLMMANFFNQLEYIAKKGQAGVEQQLQNSYCYGSGAECSAEKPCGDDGPCIAMNVVSKTGTPSASLAYNPTPGVIGQPLDPQLQDMLDNINKSIQDSHTNLTKQQAELMEHQMNMSSKIDDAQLRKRVAQAGLQAIPRPNLGLDYDIPQESTYIY